MYQIVQKYQWCDNKGQPLFPDECRVIRKFSSWWRAVVWKFWHYDFSDPSWKMSFEWKIQKVQ